MGGANCRVRDGGSLFNDYKNYNKGIRSLAWDVHPTPGRREIEKAYLLLIGHFDLPARLDVPTGQ